MTFKVNLPVFARYIIPEIQCPDSVTGQYFDIRLESDSGPSWSREDVKFSTVTRPFVPEEIGSNLNWVVNRIRVRLSGQQEEQVSMTLHVTTDDHPRFFEYLISQ